MKKKSPFEQTLPISARIPAQQAFLIDIWRRKHPQIPSRSDFVRLAIEEKLSREVAEAKIGAEKQKLITFSS